MAKYNYVGVKGDNIQIVTTSTFQSTDPNVRIVEIPNEYANLTPEILITEFRVKGQQFRRKREAKNIKDIKLAFVGNWKMRCGIATYSENLLPHIIDKVADVKLFIEHNDMPTDVITNVGDFSIKDEQVVPCWRRGESLQELVNQLKSYEPDVIWIQHEFGIWPNAGFWLSMLSQLNDYRVIVTMHSVFHHRDKTIVEAAMPEIVVHLAGAEHVLKNEKGITSPIAIIPHGCNKIVDKTRLWNYYKSEHTFMQFGFGFRYKGWEQSIRACAILKKKYNDVFFTALFSESSFNKIDHQIYYDELMSLVKELNLQENVAIIRGYQSDQTLDSYLRTNQVVVFPYTSHPEHEVFGVSGAARYAMSKMTPVITSDVNHFSDIPTIKTKSADENALASAIDLLFSNRAVKQEQVNSQAQYIDENTWDKVALKYIELFERGA